MIDIYTPTDMWSDGCTMPGVLRRLLLAARYGAACKEHDFLRGFHIVPFWVADRLLLRRVWASGGWGWVLGPLYWLFVTLAAPYYLLWFDNDVLPTGWVRYADYYRGRLCSA